MRYPTLHLLPLFAFLLGCASSFTTNTTKAPVLPVELVDPVYEAPADPSAPLAGHSSHGAAFNKGPRQAARWMEGKTGNISFPIKTNSEEAQKFFNQGIGQLHGFWTFEAERSFRQVLKLDPENPMAYWGMAMANGTNTRAKEFMEKALKHQAHTDEKGRIWISARAVFQKESDKKKRDAAYLKALQAISTQYPDDIEAKAFVVLQMYRNGVRGKKTSHYENIDKLIGEILKVNPEHPCHHYRIHLWDHKDPKRAADAIGKCGQSSPGIAHMWHMPGHILSRLKRYDDASWQMEASARVDHALQMRDGVLPDRIHNFAHNNEWLTRNLSHAGRVGHALTMAKNMIELPRIPSVKDDGTWSVSTRSSHVYGKRHLYGLLQNYELWREIIELKDTHYLRPGKSAADQAKWQRLVASAFFNTGNTAEGDALLAKMNQLLAEQTAGKKKAGDAAEAKAKKEKKKDSDVRKARTTAERPFNTAISALNRGIAEVKVHRALATGNKTEAKSLLAKATDIRNERKALMQHRVGDTAAAITTVAAAVKSGAEQARPLAAQAYLLHASGKAQEAKDAFEHLRRIAPGADLTIGAFARLAPLAKSLGLPADWRKNPTEAKDMGLRPDLDQLGPFRWQPSPAPQWILRDKTGKPLSLADFRGRPVLVVFYLGKGCSHCMEQLNGFAPAVPKFKNLGIDIVAVSTDTVTGLRETFPTFSAEAKQFPFPLVSDARLDTFKAFRAYDDFEQTPLHGTFLIDGTGKIRWQDISHEPFTAVNFLLEEAERLLSLPN
ncbi:MAG: alkyl hydroperoxide reductase [Verrucomicrobiales bacterium]|nr:alkyl hydroperoxide reductase [Verrucomicrobiales bacterium]